MKNKTSSLPSTTSWWITISFSSWTTTSWIWPRISFFLYYFIWIKNKNKKKIFSKKSTTYFFDFIVKKFYFLSYDLPIVQFDVKEIEEINRESFEFDPIVSFRYLLYTDSQSIVSINVFLLDSNSYQCIIGTYRSLARFSVSLHQRVCELKTDTFFFLFYVYNWFELKKKRKRSTRDTCNDLIHREFIFKSYLIRRWRRKRISQSYA